MAANHIQLSIPEPCHEGWNNMLAVDEQRAHCKSCNRVLTDFSQMSDTELALWFAQSKGRLCGHFSKSQLDRPILVPTNKPVRKNWLSALWLLPLAWFAKPGHAQTISGKPPVCVNDGSQVASQKQAQDTTVTQGIVSGVVKAKDTDKPLEGATVTLKFRSETNPGTGQLETIVSTKTNSKGEYTLTIPKNSDLTKDHWYIEALHEDFMRSIIPFPATETPATVNFSLRDEYEMMDGVIMYRPPAKKTK